MGGWGGGVPLLCSSSFEVFNSFFVIYSSAHISSISVLAQQFHSQRLLFSPVAQGLCPAPGWHSFFYLNSEMLTKLNSFSLPSSPLLPALPLPIQALVPTEAEWAIECAWVLRSTRVPVFLKHRKCIKERRVQLEPWLPHFCFFLLLPPSPCCPPPPPPPKHQLLIFKSTAIAWCGFKCWGAILPDDDSADVNGILIVPSATSETSPLRLLLFTVPGLQ